MDHEENGTLKRFLSAKAYRNESGWDDKSLKAFRYLLGDQWSADDISYLARNNRPASVFNMILPGANAVIGHFIRAVSDVSAKPVDQWADPYIARLLRICIKNIEQTNYIAHEQIQQFWDGFITGIGVREIYRNYDVLDDVEIKDQQRSPWNFYLDKHFKRYDYTDAHTLHRENWMTKSEIETLYGKDAVDKLPEISAVSQATDLQTLFAVTSYGKNYDYGNKSMTGIMPENNIKENAYLLGYDIETNLYRVVEEYLKENVQNKYYYVEEKDQETGEDTSHWNLFDDLGDDEQELVKGLVVTKNETRLRLTTIIGTEEIQSELLDQSEFYQSFNFFFPYFWNGTYMGAIENQEYPQEEINKRRSSIVHILSTIASGGYLYNGEAFTNKQESEVRENFAKTGSLTKVDNLYNEKGQLNIIPKQSPAIQAIYEKLIATDTNTIQYGLGVPDSFQGIDKRKESGRAKQADTAQAAQKHSGVMENFKLSQRLAGLAYIWWIQNTYTEEKIIRIYGGTFGETDEEIVINRRSMGKIFNDMSVGKYDVVIDYAGKTTTERDATKFRLIEMAKMAPDLADILIGMVIELEEFPGKDKIKQLISERQQMMLQNATQQPPPGQGQGVRPNRGVRRQPQRVQSA